MLDDLLAHAAPGVYLSALAHAHLLRGDDEGHWRPLRVVVRHPDIDGDLVRCAAVVDGQRAVQEEEEGCLARVEG